MNRAEAGRRVGQSRRGENNWTAKLKESDVRKIRSSAEKYEDLAAKYNLHVDTVAKIRARKRWEHVE